MTHFGGRCQLGQHVEEEMYEASMEEDSRDEPARFRPINIATRWARAWSLPEGLVRCLAVEPTKAANVLQ